MPVQTLTIIMYISGMACLVGFGPRLLNITIYDQDEWAYLLYMKWLRKIEPTILKQRLKEIKNGTEARLANMNAR